MSVGFESVIGKAEKQRLNQCMNPDERKEYAYEILGGICVRCGTSENLEFDHIDPSTKLFNITKAYQYSWQKFIDELAKCQLLCTDCHKKKTKTERGFDTIRHGTAHAYQKHKCRCEPCRDAWSAKHLKYMEKVRGY